MNSSYFSISAAILFSLVTITLASFAIQPATVHPSRPNTCFNKEKNSFYEDGDSWQIEGKCEMASCMKIRQPSGTSQMMISYEGCGSVGYEPPCYIEEDKTAQYPDCCPQIACPSGEQDYETTEDLNNEVDVDDSPASSSLQKNETNKEKEEKKPIELRDYDYGSLERKEREWERNGLNLQSLDAYYKNDFYDNEYTLPGGSEEETRFSRKISPKFYLW